MISLKNMSLGGDFSAAGAKTDICLEKANIGGNLDLTGVVGIIDLKGAFIRGSINLTNVILVSANLEGARFGEIIYDHKSTTFLNSETGKICFPVVNKDDRGEYFEFI